MLEPESAALTAGNLHARMRVGPYELIRPLGAGGMAQVWLARRADGAFRREVALKLPALTHLRADLEQRFAQERDILASLEHPHIARFYDAGVDPNGLSYLALEYVEGFNAADSTIIGVAALAKQQQAEDEIDSGRLFHLQRGYDALPRYLAGEIESAGGSILLGTEARQIAWQRGAVTISGAHDDGTAFTLAAKRALISVPLGVLQAGTIEFAPRPEVILAHAARLKMGAVVRVTLMFSRRFWAGLARPTLSAEVQAALGRLSFLFTYGATPSIWWTPMPNTAPMITAWVAGSRVGVLQRALKSIGNGNALLELSLTGLAAAFDVPVTDVRKLLVSWHTHDWLTDRYARGAYSYAPAGALDASARMTEPVDDTLYFAGEHTDTSGHWGTVHGALRSGLRAATQLRSAGN